MFAPVELRSGAPFSAEYAARRADNERLVEVAATGRFRMPALARARATSSHRGALALRLVHGPVPASLAAIARRAELQRTASARVVHAVKLGANPFRFGLIGSTDTHLGARALVATSAAIRGTAGAASRSARRCPTRCSIRSNTTPRPRRVWAEENSRDALFEALFRRETFATSGPRIAFRLFAGWNLAPDLCARDFAKRGDAEGVAMGGELPAPPPGERRARDRRLGAPGSRDRGLAGRSAPAAPDLKLWSKTAPRASRSSTRGEENGASVDPATCDTTGAGSPQLCAVWQDPGFDPAAPALYFARVVQTDCRWSLRPATRRVCALWTTRARSAWATRAAAKRRIRNDPGARLDSPCGTRPMTDSSGGWHGRRVHHARVTTAGGRAQQQPPEKHNAANDAMDAQLLAGALRASTAATTCARSCGAATARRSSAATPRSSACAPRTSAPRLHRARPRRTPALLHDPAPIIVALKGWVIVGGSFERARCYAPRSRVRALGSAAQISRTVWGPTGGYGAPFQIAGHGLAADLASHRPRARRARGAAPRSRGRASCPTPSSTPPVSRSRTRSDCPRFTVKMFRRTLGRLANRGAGPRSRRRPSPSLTPGVGRLRPSSRPRARRAAIRSIGGDERCVGCRGRPLVYALARIVLEIGLAPKRGEGWRQLRNCRSVPIGRAPLGDGFGSYDFVLDGDGRSDRTRAARGRSRGRRVHRRGGDRGSRPPTVWRRADGAW